MSYLLAQILVCLLIAGLIGALIGWWLRGGCKRKLKELDSDWTSRYETDKAIWQGKIDVTEGHIQKSLHQNNDEWDVKLRDAESTWEGKVQGLVGKYDAKINSLNGDRQLLEDELLTAKQEAKRAKEELTKVNHEWDIKLKDTESSWEDKLQGVTHEWDSKSGDKDKELQELKAILATTQSELDASHDEWSMKLKDVESSWEGKVQGIKGDYASKSVDDDALKSLQLELEKAKAEAKDATVKLTQANDEWNFKFKDLESSWEGKVEAVKSDFQAKSGGNNSQLEALKAKLEDAKAEANEAKAALTRADEQWSMKLKDAEATWAGKIQAVESEYDSKVGSSDEELEALKVMLEKAEAQAKDATAKLAKTDDEWNLKLKDTEASWEGKVQSVKSEYDSKVGDNDQELKALKSELEKTKSELKSSNDSWGMKLKDIETKSDSSDKKLKSLESELENAQKEAKKVKAELESSNDEWSRKLKNADSSWEGKVQTIMSDYDGKMSAADKEKASLKANLNSAKAEADAAKDEMLKSDGELFGALGHIEESYEVEALEGIGAGYGKKFRALGVSTTDEFASKFLNNEKEAAKAAKKTGIDKDAILAWGSMADLISLPGINPDDAELLQAVGVSSKEELTKQDAKSLHDKMVAYNSKHKIAPDVPSTALLLKLTKLPDNKTIAKAVSAVKGEGEHKADSYDVEEIEGIGAGYGKKFRSFGVSTTAQFADKFLNNDGAVEKAAKETGIEVNAIKAWASMADLMRLPGVDGQYAEIMQAVGVSSVKELGKFDANILHDKMLKYNKTNSIVPEVPSAEFLSTWAKSTASTNGSEASDDKSTNEHLNECYEIEEVEGIGPGYGKKFRNLGINTTCDLANTYLRDNKATKKASKKMGVDFDAIKSWATMADLMRLPGVDGQYAEIMQTVGLDSRKELTHISLNHLHELMVEFNAKNPIVPEVPTMDMLVAWSSAAKKQK